MMEADWYCGRHRACCDLKRRQPCAMPGTIWKPCCMIWIWSICPGKCGWLNPHAACQSVLAFAGRYRLPFFFAGSRAAAEYTAWGFLRQYLEGARKRWAAIVKAHDAA